MLRARDGRLPTMQTMRQWRPKVPHRVFPAISCIFCEEDTGHMHITCKGDVEVAPSLCAKVEECTADPPLENSAMELMSQQGHGSKWTVSLMAVVLPSDLRRLSAVVRSTSPRGPAKGKLLLEDMIVLGEDGYVRRNHCLTRTMQLPPGDRRRATYSFLREHTPFCLRAGKARQLSRGISLMAYWVTFSRPLNGRRCMHCWYHGPTKHTTRSCPHFPNGWRLQRWPSVPGWSLGCFGTLAIFGCRPEG